MKVQGSMKMQQILNARLPEREGLYCLDVGDRGLVKTVRPMTPELVAGDDCLDLAEAWLSLGGVDLQINGALGLPFPELTLAALPQTEKIGALLWQQGVDAYLPTLITAPAAKVRQALETIARSMEYTAVGQARVLGAHLEGPFLNPEKRGAHPQAYLQDPTPTHLEALVGEWAQIVRVMTLAPELDPAGETIAVLRSQGATVSLGHSLATAAEAERAFGQGVTMVTHAFNAMPSLHHREPGLLGAALARAGAVRCGFIADGQHVDPRMLQLLLRAGLGARGLFLVSDAIAPLGLPDGDYPWDQLVVKVRNGTARLETGTLAGTTLSLLAGVQNLVRWQLCEPDVAIALATSAPREAIGLATDLVGQPAGDLLRWSLQPETGELQWQRLHQLSQFGL